MHKSNRFGPRLRELRTAKGMTQQELADKSNFSMNTIARYERGELVPIWPSVVKLAEVLKIDVREFLAKPKDVSARGPGRPPASRKR